MDKQQQEMFVVQADLDREVYTLKQAIWTANQALQKLQKNVDLSFLPEPDGITTEWLHEYVYSRVDAVNKNIIFDAETSSRLVKGWQKIQETALPDVKTVEKFCRKFSGLIRYDEEARMMMFIDLESLAIKRVEKPLPPECSDHITMIECIKNMVFKLRQWEKAHRCYKKPLEWLLKADSDTLKAEWCTGSIFINDIEESQDYNRTSKWLRKSYEDTII